LDEAARRGDGVKLETKPYESVSAARRRRRRREKKNAHTSRRHRLTSSPVHGEHLVFKIYTASFFSHSNAAWRHAFRVVQAHTRR
jgi:hypothetical protein